MDRIVVVTGGFGVLGRAVGAWFKAHDDHVVRLDFADESADGPIAGGMDIGGVDLANADACAAAIARIVDELGGIDVLVNVAGGFTWETVGSASIETWARMQTMNLMTAATVTRLALPHLLVRPAARIVSIGAGAANRADMPDADFTQWVRPEALADVIGFLASPAARAISGALVPVTRGA